MITNNVTLLGGVVRDAKIFQTTSGKLCAKYTMGINRGWGDKQTTDYIPVTAWGPNAEWAQKFAKKGVRIILQGNLHTDSYEKNGTTVYSIEVLVEGQEFAERKSVANGISANQTAISGTAAAVQSNTQTVTQAQAVVQPQNIVQQIPVANTATAVDASAQGFIPMGNLNTPFAN